MYIVGFFVICQTGNNILFREPLGELLFVLKHAPVQIIGHAGVYGTGWAIHDVDVVFLHGWQWCHSEAQPRNPCTAGWSLAWAGAQATLKWGNQEITLERTLTIRYIFSLW